MKNFLRNMASLIVAVAMNMAALIIVVAMSMTALIIVVAMITIFVAVIWTNRWFLIKKAIVILAYTAIIGMVGLLLHLSNKKVSKTALPSFFCTKKIKYSKLSGRKYRYAKHSTALPQCIRFRC